MKLLGALALLPILSSALKFDLVAQSGHSPKNERCIRNFVTQDTLVVVTAIVSGNRGDGMMVNMHIKDAVGNDYGRPKDVAGEKRMAFTSLADTAFDVCFENTLTGRSHIPNPTRHVELDIDIGADARDWSAIQANEKLKPVEADLRRIEETVNEIVQEMEYLRIREQKLRDTNESTNERVKWFAFGTMGMLVEASHLVPFARNAEDVYLISTAWIAARESDTTVAKQQKPKGHVDRSRDSFSVWHPKENYRRLKEK
ncbi:Endoplasmic reticulum vesicle protein 25 [Cladophialophora carrionii]|uniref:Endoplasmic reticulum vesicle protein 25 n=1 Tax=Cladophialophora carrionii TaxID=86049 RepID=A0A1C1CWW8_9EURO|nr:Endoplasmic reticulum vesicle protein 25 [Cladophialophora carrionii]